MLTVREMRLAWVLFLSIFVRVDFFVPDHSPEVTMWLIVMMSLYLVMYPPFANSHV